MGLKIPALALVIIGWVSNKDDAVWLGCGGEWLEKEEEVYAELEFDEGDIAGSRLVDGDSALLLSTWIEFWRKENCTDED